MVKSMMQEMEGSMGDFQQDKQRVLLELAEEARPSWEERAKYYAACVINLADEAFEALDERKWSIKDCLEYRNELDWEMRAFHRISGEHKPSEMSIKMKKAAQQLQERVSQEVHHATWIVDCKQDSASPRLQVRDDPHHSNQPGQPQQAGLSRRVLGQPLAYKDSDHMGYQVPMNRRPTLRVAAIQGAAGPEHSSDDL
jgi:hypothetical protein